MVHFFLHCDPFFTLWPTWKWLSFYRVVHFSLCDQLFTLKTILYSAALNFPVTHFSRCDLLFQMWPLFNAVNHLNGVILSQCVTPSSKCHLFITAWPILFLVIFLQFYPLFQTWLIFHRVIHLSQCDSFFQIRPCFTMRHIVLKCHPFFTVWNFLQRNTFFDKYFIFHSVTH